MLMLIYQLKKQPLRKKDFNTSHVNVNLFITSTLTASVRDFNTSHVNVNQLHILSCLCMYRISIHLMLMLIVRRTGRNLQVPIDFNTSHVNVNPINLSLFQSRLNLSLPILSHFSKNYQPISLFLTMGLINLQPQVFTGLLEIFFINCLVNTCII